MLPDDVAARMINQQDELPRSPDMADIDDDQRAVMRSSILQDVEKLMGSSE